jgi:para-aminobenzoate synthetase/4-amino-4-deoxychorismate lyase
MDVFALLDDRQASDASPTSRLYTGFVREHRCGHPALLDEVWRQVDADLAAGLHAVLLADYEWGAKLIGAGTRGLAPGDASALRVLMFRTLERCSDARASAWLQAQEPAGAAPAGTMDVQPSVSGDEFSAAIARIHEAIAAGETYQVNYTYRVHGRTFGAPLALYRELRARQPVRYGAFVALPPGQGASHVLSCSPELFLRHEAGTLTARPMKGTAGRIVAPEGDSETARLLAIDVKNRAENLMIVDLLRNDLGRVAEIGSVKVPALFAIEPYATVFQMTSTVQARRRSEVSFQDLLRATFPCGSITGAPKHHTMGLIAQYESTPRGLYCGAIGWLDAPRDGAACGDFCLSVAIRTLTLAPPSGDGTQRFALGIGAGIVKDSVAADEHEECRLKARFLTGLDPGFQLFETMLGTPGGSIRHRERHLARLARSARVFGFAFDHAQAQALLDARLAMLGRGSAWRLRLALSHDGALALAHAPLARLDEDTVELLIAPQRLPLQRPLAAHKTTDRAAYDAGVRAAEAAGAFDSLFFTADGRLAEGGRSSVFVRLDGRWWTPPLADGALAGVMRGVLLEDPAWQAGERTLSLADLQRAQALVVCNALRGALPARLAQAAIVAA